MKHDEELEELKREKLIEEVRDSMDFDEDKRVCFGCGYWFPKDDMIKSGGEWLCEDCYVVSEEVELDEIDE